jgi:hypothetical protein
MPIPASRSKLELRALSGAAIDARLVFQNTFVGATGRASTILNTGVLPGETLLRTSQGITACRTLQVTKCEDQGEKQNQPLRQSEVHGFVDHI